MKENKSTFLNENNVLYRRILYGKSYIGITRGYEDSEVLVKKRAGKNGRGYKDQKKFFDAIKKYGWSNVRSEILYEHLNKEQAKQLETYFIMLYNSDKTGYNCNRGNGNQELCMDMINTGDLSPIKALVDYTPEDKNTQEKNQEFVDYCKEHLVCGKDKINKLAKVWGIKMHSLTHYMYKSSDPGKYRYDPIFYNLYNGKTPHIEKGLW